MVLVFQPIFEGVRRSVSLPAVTAVLCLIFAAAAAGQDPTPSPVPTILPTPVPTPLVTEPNNDVMSPPADLPPDPPPVAPNFTAPLRPLPGAERVGVDNADQLSLSLDDAIERALDANNEIDTFRQDKQIEDLRLRVARGVYDPLIVADGYYESASTPTASLIGGAVNGSVTQTRFFGSGGISGFTPRFGGSYTARLDASRSTTSNTNAFLNPQYPSVLALTYRQPLWRGLRIDNNRRTIEVAKRNIEISESQLRQKVIEIVAEVERAYWDLAFALRNLQVQIDSVRQARAQAESNQRQVDRGILAPIEVVAANAQITTLEQAVYAAQADVTRFENILKTLILPERTSPEWRRPITPVSPIELTPPAIGLEVSIAEALSKRSELDQLEESAAINQIDQRFFRDQTKPRIDLVTSTLR